MRLLILSDLHRKIWKNQSPKMDLAISRPVVVVLAGDIDTGTKAVEWAARIRLAAKGYRKLRTGDTTQLHAIHRSRLQQTLGQPFDGKTVVITHMAPSMKSVSEEYNTAPVSAAYASRLEDSMQNVELWVHGHMHQSIDYRVEKCRVVCNPCGI